MTRFERLLGSGLRSTGASETHLDADQVCAFVENGTGRAAVMEHAARCSECREALFLASGERFSPAPNRSWRWASIPAGAAVCALGVAIPIFLHRDTRPGIAIALPSQPPVEFPTAGPPVPLASKPVLKTPVVPKESRAKVDDERIPNVAQAEPPMAAPPPPNLVEAEQVKPVVPSQPSPLSGQSQQASSDQTQAQQRYALRQFNQTAKAQQSSPAAFFDPPGQSIKQRRFSAPLLGIAPALPAHVFQWTVTEGFAEQSGDAGLTWRQVPIDENIHFLAIGNTGNDVWAGGAGGALFHSYDNGEHWRSINVMAGVEKLRSDIVTLRVVSRQEIQVVAASGEHWTSQDGGRTWKRE